MTSGAPSTCRTCVDDLAHCHGTLIVHPSAHVECTVDDCDDTALVMHTLRVDCDALGCGCAVTVRRVATG